MSGVENVRAVERLDEGFKSIGFSRVQKAVALIDNPGEAFGFSGTLPRSSSRCSTRRS